MKITKKKVFVAALAVCLVAILSLGTLAWFSAQDSVTNNFYIADSTDNDPDDIFSVDVYEKYDSDEDEDEVPEEYQSGISYKDILPGDNLAKDAFVKNTGHYDQYIRVVITISDASVWQQILGDDAIPNRTLLSYFDGLDQSKWNHISTKVLKQTNEVSIVMYYKEVLPAGDTINIFNGVAIPEAMTQEHASHFDDDGIWGFTIGVKAQAVQTDNVGADAFEAFQTVGMAIE